MARERKAHLLRKVDAAAHVAPLQPRLGRVDDLGKVAGRPACVQRLQLLAAACKPPTPVSSSSGTHGRRAPMASRAHQPPQAPAGRRHPRAPGGTRGASTHLVRALQVHQVEEVDDDVLGCRSGGLAAAAGGRGWQLGRARRVHGAVAFTAVGQAEAPGPAQQRAAQQNTQSSACRRRRTLHLMRLGHRSNPQL